MIHFLDPFESKIFVRFACASVRFVPTRTRPQKLIGKTLVNHLKLDMTDVRQRSNCWDLRINNVVCNFTLPMHIDLRKLAMNTWNVIYDRTSSVTKQKRNPNCYIKLQSSGKVFIVGCKSEVECRQASRAIGRTVQKIMGKSKERVCLKKYRVCNIMATCKFPFGIQISEIARQYPNDCSYEPELSVGLEWKYKEPKASLRIHTTGTVTVTGATSEANVHTVLERIYDIVYQFRCDPRNLPPSTVIRKRPVQYEDDLGLGLTKRGRVSEFPIDFDEDTDFQNLYFEDEEDLEGEEAAI
uniref:TATA box-binding protein-like 1 n=1 Tax=Panagrolaimus sp. JU765 TaxID=591449 RepID=A0AC34QRJ7_9BILA